MLTLSAMMRVRAPSRRGCLGIALLAPAIVGDMIGFVFAPQSLVTLIGSMSVVFNLLIAPVALKGTSGPSATASARC
eukprot:SAG11_NODE_106_length_16423_cov_51.220840_29_plen_77_part_00